MADAARFRLLVPTAVLLFIVVACDSPSEPPAGEPPTGPTGPHQPPEPGGALECEIRRYPCSLADVPLEILERMDALGDEVIGMLAGGATTGETAAWLADLEDVAEVEWEPRVIWFRVEGGRGVWILREGALARPAPSGGDAVGFAPLALPPPSADVVAAESKEKRALVLSPFEWEFAEWGGVAAAAANALVQTRGYEHPNGVEHIRNPMKTSSDVGLDSFRGWGAFQVIHVATHGTRVCKDGGCRAMLSAGLAENLLLPGTMSDAEKLKSLSSQGIEVGKDEESGLVHVLVTADFFRNEHPDGVADALIVLNSCMIYGPAATDLVDALQGNGTVVFGWDEVMYLSDAAAVAAALYHQMAGLGYPARVAYDELGAVATGTLVPGSPSAPRLRIRERSGGGDLRIRDNIYLLNPRTGRILVESHRVPIDGAMGDGQPDAVPFRVSVDGVKPEFAGGMIVRVSVDGASSDPAPLTSGEYLDDGRWDVEGSVQLPYDVAEERVAVFRAEVDLHDGGDSEHESAATLTGGEPIMGWTWAFEAEYETHLTTFVDGAPLGGITRQWARAELVLGFREDQDLAEPAPTYLLTEGIVSGDFSSTHTFSFGACHRKYGPFTFALDEPPYWVPSFAFLNFDTDFDPVRYSGTIRIFAPILDGTIDCGSGPEPDTYAPHASYMEHEPNEGLFVAEDGRTITGTWYEEVTTVLNERAYSVRYHTSRYTITRIE
jgi:hypothetical protein